ncbi:MAG TPA: hypothetical protein VF471_09390 [Pseudoxanthomonas sp.]
MSFRFASVVLALTLWGWQVATPVAATEISSFRSGLVCDPGERGWICIDTEDIHLTGQGRCVFNKEEFPCTWYGFSFDYQNSKPGTSLVCTYKSSMPASMGNPKEVLAEDTDEGTYSLPLDGASGTFYNPQYTVLRTAEAGQAVVVTSSRCTVDGKEVARFRFNIIAPARSK